MIILVIPQLSMKIEPGWQMSSWSSVQEIIWCQRTEIS
jgi:hypothetical protein